MACGGGAAPGLCWKKLSSEFAASPSALACLSPSARGTARFAVAHVVLSTGSLATNGNPLKPSWGASLGATRSVLGLEGRKVTKRATHFGTKPFSVMTNLSRIFLSVLHSIVFSCVALVMVMAWASPVAGFGFWFRWSLGRPLLCGFRKRGFQEVSCKTSFPFSPQSTMLVVPSTLCARWPGTLGS